MNRIRANINGTAYFINLATNNYAIKLPVLGVYAVTARVGFAVGGGASADFRATTLWRKTTAAFDGVGVENIVCCTSMPAERGGAQTSFTTQFSADEEIRVGAWQNSGSSRDIGNVSLEVTLLSPAPTAVMP
jgi:hypothetical protein